MLEILERSGSNNELKFIEIITSIDKLFESNASKDDCKN